MLDIKRTVVKNMSKITLILMAVILFLSTAIQIFDTRQNIYQNAQQTFYQVEQILDENSKELEQIQQEYATSCLNNARTAAYILEYNPKAKDSSKELRKIAADMEVDEIHIFDTDGVIVAGTHPKYFGYSFDSGNQMRFFKPLLTDPYMEMVQDIMPNTAEGKLVQYSALWSENKKFIVQIGMYPASVLQVTKKNELSYIFSLLRAGVGYRLYAVDPDTGKVVGSMNGSDVGKSISKIGFEMEQLTSDDAFYAKPGQIRSYCLSKRIGENYIVWATPLRSYCQVLCKNGFLLLAGLVLISVFLIFAVTHTMNQTVIKPAAEKLEMGKQIEEQKKELAVAVEHAEAANKAKSEFLFHISHDIRTPMNAILGFTSLALESQEPEIQKEYLKNINVSSKQLLDMLNDILELASIENHKIVINEELCNIKEIYNKLYTIFDSDLKKKNLTYTAKQDIGHPYMYIDTTHYVRIFLNLVGNAIKFTPDGGTIHISFRELPGEDADTCLMETVVADNGIGMSEEFLPRACESFSRERTSTVSGVAGTGLGLTIVKDLVELMKGTISIESRQGRGTKVTIRLPHRLGKNPGTESTKAKASPENVSFEGRRILLAEDIDINAVIAMKLLSARGFLTDRARDGIECVNMLQNAEEGFYELVLMDIQMPNMDGYEATQAIRSFENKAKASIPILAITANTLKEDREKAADAGMNGYIAKPLDTTVMFQTIAEALQ